MIIYCPDYRVLETQGQGLCEKHDMGTQGHRMQRLLEEQLSGETEHHLHPVHQPELHAPVIQADLSPSLSGTQSTNSEHTLIDQTITQGAEQGMRNENNRDEAIIVKYNPKTKGFERPVKPRRNPNGGLGA